MAFSHVQLSPGSHLTTTVAKTGVKCLTAEYSSHKTSKKIYSVKTVNSAVSALIHDFINQSNM